jgi:hypothetical protein
MPKEKGIKKIKKKLKINYKTFERKRQLSAAPNEH